ncbi:MAG: hypothetical protein R2909_16775 [Gemmatimonadales bacterium]
MVPRSCPSTRWSPSVLFSVVERIRSEAHGLLAWCRARWQWGRERPKWSRSWRRPHERPRRSDLPTGDGARFRARRPRPRLTPETADAEPLLRGCSTAAISAVLLVEPILDSASAGLKVRLDRSARPIVVPLAPFPSGGRSVPDPRRSGLISSSPDRRLQ